MNNQHRDRRIPDDPLGGAPRERACESGETAAPHHDEVRMVLFRSLGAAPRDAFVQRGGHGNVSPLRELVELLLGVLFGVCGQCGRRNKCPGPVRVDGNLISVHEHNRGAEFSGKLEPCVERDVRGLAEVGGNENSAEGTHRGLLAVHADSMSNERAKTDRRSGVERVTLERATFAPKGHKRASGELRNSGKFPTT